MKFDLFSFQMILNRPFPLNSWIDRVLLDSREIDSQQGCNALFVALPGKKRDGHAYVSQALSNGAHYALVKKNYQGDNISEEQLIRVEDPLASLQAIAAQVRREWGGQLIAIMGTIGKTTLKDFLVDTLSSYARVYGSPESFNSQIGVTLSLLRLSSGVQLAVIEAAFTKEGEIKELMTMLQPNYLIITSLAMVNLGTLHFQKVLTTDWMIDQLVYGMTYARHLKAIFVPEKFANKFSHPHTISHAPEFDQTIDEQVKATTLLIGRHLHLAINENELHHHKIRIRKEEVWRTSKGAIVLNLPPVSDLGSLRGSLGKNLMAIDRYTAPMRHMIFEGFYKTGGEDSNNLWECLKLFEQAQIDHLYLVGEEVRELFIPHPKFTVTFFENWPALLCSLQNEVGQDHLLAIQSLRQRSQEEISPYLDPQTYTTQLTINLAAIQANFRYFSQGIKPGLRVMVMLKACGYGTESSLLALALEEMGANYFGVAHVEEGVVLRRAGVKSDIFVIHSQPQKYPLLKEYSLETGVSSLEEIHELQKINGPIPIHLHVDLGMARFGCLEEEVMTLAKKISLASNLHLKGFMTHLPSPLDDLSGTKELIQRFSKLQERLSADYSIPYYHVASTAGSLHYDQSPFNLIRIGLGIFGIGDPNLTLALRLTTRIVAINRIHKNQPVGYGSHYRASRDEERIAILPVGYYEGLHTQYSGKGAVYLHRQKAPYIGKICMDYMMVDVTEIAQAHIGDEVEIFGMHISPEELSQAGGTHVHQLITCLGSRIQRLFIYNESRSVFA